MNRLKVLQFIPSMSAKDGGTTTYMAELAPALGQLVELHICALGKAEDCVPVENATIHTIELSVRHLCRMKRQWMALLDEVLPDVLHVNCCWMPQCALVQKWALEWKKRHNRSLKTLLTPHGMLEPWIIKRNYWTKKLPAIWLYQRAAVKSADVIVSTAEEEREHVKSLGWNSNIVMVPNGICTDNIVMKQNWRNPASILFMSRLHPKKGLEMLFDAVDMLKGAVSGIDILIAGEGDPAYVESLKAKAAEVATSDIQIRFLGAVYGDRKWELIREADAVVLPSYSENFGLIVAEALASGTPVLTTKGTPWSSIEACHCGWWVEPNSNDISEALKSFSVSSAEDLKAMGLQGRALIESQFDVRKLAESLLITYKNVI